MQRPTPSIEPAQGCAQRPSVEAVLRDTREFVYELKFYIARSQAGALLQWVRTRLAPDPHGGGPHRDTYQVSSLYFDTTAYHVLGRHGSYARTKYRIRRYNQSSTAYLERKTRGQARVFKRRSATTLERLLRLQSAQSSADWEGHWFHRRLLVRSLGAVSRVDYRRVARVGHSNYGPVRLTLDEGLRVWPAREPRFDAAEGGAMLPDEQLILELKFGVAMPGVFKQLICEFGPRADGISKYRLACQQLGLTPSERAASALAPYALADATGAVVPEPLELQRQAL